MQKRKSQRNTTLNYEMIRFCAAHIFRISNTSHLNYAVPYSARVNSRLSPTSCRGPDENLSGGLQG
jgi:hypothetical protein